MGDDTEVQDFVKAMPAGMAVYHRTLRSCGMRVNGGADSYRLGTDFIVRERSEVIRAIEADPPVDVAAGLAEAGKVLAVVVMFRIGSDPLNLYEVFFNYHESSGSAPECFRDLATQDTLAFHLHGDSAEKLRTIVAANGHRRFWAEAVERIAGAEPWSMEDFDAAKKKLFALHPTPPLLFEALKRCVKG